MALKGWVIGGSLERALLCDLRIAGESAKLRLPEIAHGVVPDSGGTARLFQMAGHGLAADLALTGRVMTADEALRHGVVSRVVPDEKLDETVLEMARAIARAPELTVKMFLRTLRRLANPLVEQSLAEESVAQSLVFASEDYREIKAARAEGREPRYRGPVGTGSSGGGAQTDLGTRAARRPGACSGAKKRVSAPAQAPASERPGAGCADSTRGRVGLRRQSRRPMRGRRKPARSR